MTTGGTMEIYANSRESVARLLPDALKVLSLADKGQIAGEPVAYSLASAKMRDVLDTPLQASVHVTGQSGFSLAMAANDEVVTEAANQAVFLATGTNAKVSAAGLTQQGPSGKI
ncbi:MAG: hypothetical protein WC043_06740 [Pseudobdellovibrionaceae bacterium]